MRGAAATTNAAPLGGLTEARLLLRSGANEIAIRGREALPELYRATFDGPVPSVRLRDGTVTIQYKGSGLPWDWRKRNVDVTLNATIPWDVEVTGGSNKIARRPDRRGPALLRGCRAAPTPCA